MSVYQSLWPSTGLLQGFGGVLALLGAVIGRIGSVGGFWGCARLGGTGWVWMAIEPKGKYPRRC